MSNCIICIHTLRKRTVDDLNPEMRHTSSLIINLVQCMYTTPYYTKASWCIDSGWWYSFYNLPTTPLHVLRRNVLSRLGLSSLRMRPDVPRSAEPLPRPNKRTVGTALPDLPPRRRSLPLSPYHLSPSSIVPSSQHARIHRSPHGHGKPPSR